MAEHEQLVAEMPNVSKLSIQERLLLAKTRRAEQLKCYEQHWKVTAHAHQSVRRKTGRKSGVRFDSKTRLFEAAIRNDIDEVRSLLKSGECQPNTTNPDGFTILHQCCIDGHLDLIRSLIEDFGSSVNQPDNELWTPLHTVALCGRPQVSQLLIEHGANLLALNVDGNMPYDICEDEETLDIIEMEMSKRGVTQDQIEDLRMMRERQMLEDLQRITRQSGDLERRGIRGETPLHIAAANGYTSVAKFLLEAKVTVDAEDDDFWQPIHCGARWRQLPVLELLIINGAQLTPTTGDGRTPLDLCDDADIKQWMTELEEEVSSKQQTSLAPSHQRLLDIIASKTSLQTQTNGAEGGGGGGGGGSGQLYSSNISLAAPGDGSKTSGSSRRLATSEKELMSKRANQEEAKMRFSLQSLVEETPSPNNSQPPRPPVGKVVRLEDVIKRGSDNHQPNQKSRQSFQEDRNGSATITARTSPSLSNRGVRGKTMMTTTTVNNGQPKSCLKKTPSPPPSQIPNGFNNNHEDTPDTSSRKTTAKKIECCLVS